MMKKNTKRFNVNRRMVNERLRSQRPAGKKSRLVYEGVTNFKDDAEDIINNLDDSDKIALWRAHCEQNNDPDSEIFSNDDEFWDMMFEGKSAYEIFCDVWGTDTNPNDDYVTINGYGNPVTFNFLDDSMSPFNIDDILRYMDDLDELIDLFNDAGIDTSELDAINSLEEE